MLDRVERLSGLRVSVDDIIYMPSLDAPEDRPHPFVYFVTIHNESSKTVTVRGRKWVVEQEGGNHLVVEGDGVVGQFPRIAPSESFSYNSYHVVSNNSRVQGAYFVETEAGEIAYVPIPEFELSIPSFL